MILINILFKICLSIRHTLINHSQHDFWNLSWIFDFQESMRMRFFLFTIFTIIKIFANTTFVSWTNNRSNSTTITFNIKMRNCRFNLLGLLFLILVRDIILFLHLNFFLFFNNTLDQLFWLLVHWIFYHLFYSFFLFFPNFFFNIFRRFSTFFTFFAFFCIFSKSRIRYLNLFNFIFNIWITWSWIHFFYRVFTIRLIFILQRFRLSLLRNLFLFFLNKILESFLIYISIFLDRLIFQVTFLSDIIDWQDFEFQILIFLALSPIVCS